MRWRLFVVVLHLFVGRKCCERILPIKLRPLADVWPHHLRIPTGLCRVCWGLLCSVPPSHLLHRRQNHSFARSLQGAPDCVAHQTMSQQIFLSGAARLFPPPPLKKNLWCGTTEAMSGCHHKKQLNLHFACCRLVSIQNHHRLVKVGFLLPVSIETNK